MTHYTIESPARVRRGPRLAADGRGSRSVVVARCEDVLRRSWTAAPDRISV